MRNQLLLFGLMLVPSWQAKATEGPAISVAPSLVKVRPTQPLPKEAVRNGPIRLTAARGECEAAHLIVSAGANPVQKLEVSASTLKPKGGKAKDQITVNLYREAFLDLKTASDIQGATGLWPDPLIPAVDQIAGEKRNAFPVDVPARQHQPVFVEVCVPRSVEPGRYVGSLTASAKKLPPTNIAVEVNVEAVTIPATSSIPVTFGLSGKSLLYGHYGEKRKDNERLELVERYAKSALRHRISLHSMSMIPPVVSGDGASLTVDFSGWDAEIGPFMDGTALPDGARFTAIDLRTPPGLRGASLDAYYKAVAKHFKAKGWDDRLFAYVMDEPKKKQMGELTQKLQALMPAHNPIRRMVTTPFQSSLAGQIEIWTPNINCLAFKKEPNEFCEVFTPRSAYDTLQKAGQQLWWYQSCSSHGCKQGPFGNSVDQYFTGWPSYMIDADGAANRIMSWQTFVNRVDGELYFDMAFAFNGFESKQNPRVDPWDSVWAFGGNGDGTLFYPGRPEKVGGKTDIPIESLRMKLIRDGLEDYELLRILSNQGLSGAKQAQAIAGRMAPKLYEFQRSPAGFEQSREAIFSLLRKNGTISGGRPRAQPQ